ncbi:prostaglandin E2 receptor EP1 subtype [Hyla sarda]|uniref:prostaglandin E2 receptor EP1 subtype n=1 Tax=Hyla sarda TaxID=327740 RepID=UPI0024C42496|nr:prostaglandin E2 receptor EP1 subtype [Hyla sarda]XP_056426717.1 prostaglandin E2 receptor EP1 subtype [Hyla sarda]
MYPPLHPNSSFSTVFSPIPPTSPLYSTPPSSRPPTSTPLLPSLSMAIGALSNALGLWILARAYSVSRRLRRSRAQFLLLASGLLLTDLAGHLITGSFVLWLYSNGALPMAGCQFLGGCMVFFGLSPLLLGLLMACERCIGLTRPLWHSAVVTQSKAWIGLGLAWALALLVSTLPLLGYGTYGLQPSGTWCFLQEPPGFCLLFSGLGLGSLTAALVCNLVVGVTLLQARLLRASGEDRRRRRRGARSHDLEMMVQLLAITIVSCVCWSPLLVSVVMLQAGAPLPRPNWLLFTVRLASCNQILDPWVYILLRRSVLHRLCSIFVRVSRVRGGKPIRWDPRDFQSSEHSQISHL